MADRRTKRSSTRRSTTRTKRSAHGRRASTRKLSPGARAWNEHVMKTFNDMRKKNRAATFKDALRAAAKTFKK
jgi:hypothetical protein